MKKFIDFYLETFFGKKLDLRVKLFHVLAITGFLICVVMTGVSIAGGMVASTMINMGAGCISLFLLIYSSKKGNYQFCYIVTIVVIFFILFPSLFFSGGGYKGGMPFFFIFAVVFTVYMLDGWIMLGSAIIELIFYSYLCIIAYEHPEWVIPFQSERAVIFDVIVGLVTVSISLGATMFIQIRMYQRQQEDLEQAQHDAEEANRAKSAFLANMSHEIRTPIHMILGVNEIILRESHVKQIREYSQTIDETSKMLLSLVNSILDVSKIESGKMELIESVYESKNLVSTLALIGRTHCSKKKLKFSCHIAENLPDRMVGDLPHIQQIVTNFLSNAAKYTETGGVILTVSQEPSEKKDEIYLCISVQDTGIGIKEEAIPTLFDAFVRADLVSHRHIAGTGLGLAIVKELADLMHGTIRVESEHGAGSTFTVRIPQKIVQESLEDKTDQEMTFEAPDVKVLVVDDNAGNCMIMQELLLPTKMQVDTARSGKECVKMVCQKSYDVILMDYMMPEMNGLETLQQLKTIKGFDVPVIALTADATSETRKKLMDGGFSSCLTKPIPWKRLQKELLSYFPSEFVIMVPEKQNKSETCKKIQLLEAPLLTYGISIEEGIKYFSNDMKEYCAVVQVFLSHDQEERRKVEKLWQEGNCSQLSFHIHALKGKARNLGIAGLADVCAYMENICIANQKEEVHSLMPYLLYLWQKGSEGLAFLEREMKIEEEVKSCLPENCDYEEMLPQFLEELQRKPSLECIQGLLSQEDSEEGKKRLKKISELVNLISFEQAESEFDAYLEWKKENK